MIEVAERRLELRFRVESETELTPSDFVELFRCAESLSRHLFERQAQTLLAALDMPSQWRLEALQRIHSLGRRVPVPGHVSAVERGSWEVVVLLGGPAVLWVLKEYLHPVVKDAWDQSAIRDRLLTFLRDRLFGGARQQVEEKAVQQPRFGNLEIVEVTGDDSDPRPGVVVVRLEQRRVIAIAAPDRNLVEEFVHRLSG